MNLIMELRGRCGRLNLMSVASWVLRLTLAGQLAGAALVMLVYDGSTIAKYIWHTGLEADQSNSMKLSTDFRWIDGLDNTGESDRGRPETGDSFYWDKAAGWFILALAVSVIVWPNPLVLSLAALFFFAWASSVYLLGGSKYFYLAHGAQCVRVCLPLAMLFWWSNWRGQLITKSGTHGLSPYRLHKLGLALRIGIAATFATHGYEAFAGNPEFVDLILLGLSRAYVVGIPQVVVEHSLKVIGALDILVAFLIIVRRWKWVAAWMSFWGFLTLSSRITAYGFGAGYHESLIRLANGGVPLVLLLLWSVPESHRKSFVSSDSGQPEADEGDRLLDESS